MGAFADDPPCEVEEEERMTQDFASFLRSLGLVPRSIVADGKWRRCPTEDHPRKRNGSYLLAIDGRVGFGQNWASMDEVAVWKAGKEAELPAVDLEAMRRADAEHARMRLQAVHAARAFYARCTPLRGGHPYLEAHGLDMTGCFGLRVDKDGWLVIPAWRGNELMSVQRIAPDGSKRFWPGAPIAGTQYVIRKNEQTAVTVLCEGLATGLACVAALVNTGWPARGMVLWDAGNLARAALNPNGWLVIAADNDYRTLERTGKNPGLEAAHQAATRLGAGVAYPEGIQGTDWCDYRTERRDERNRKKLPHQTTRAIERGLDGEIAQLLMRSAKYVVPSRAMA